MARITYIQTGAERTQGQPGHRHNEDIHGLLQAANERAARLVAETQAGIQARRDRIARFPS